MFLRFQLIILGTSNLNDIRIAIDCFSVVLLVRVVLQSYGFSHVITCNGDVVLMPDGFVVTIVVRIVVVGGVVPGDFGPVIGD